MSRKKKSVTPWERDGPPRNIGIYWTPTGWRHSIVTESGGRLCGQLASIPLDAGEDEAKAAAGKMIQDLAATFHSIELEVLWTCADDSARAWNGVTQPPVKDDA
jgi:hypothetical protein